MPVCIDQNLNTTSFNSNLIAIESIAEKTHHLARAGYIAKLDRQIKQANLVIDDFLLKITHGITPLRFRVWLIKFHTSIKLGNPPFGKTLLPDQGITT